ncbi:hypothetical protein L345_15981, partial [Ophiophagus hannah]
MIHRLRFTTDVQLGISGDKVEVDPVTNQKASTKFWIKQKPISIDSELLCTCDLAEEKSPRTKGQPDVSAKSPFGHLNPACQSQPG